LSSKLVIYSEAFFTKNYLGWLAVLPTKTTLLEQGKGFIAIARPFEGANRHPGML
jgi:hypothetical protein